MGHRGETARPCDDAGKTLRVELERDGRSVVVRAFVTDSAGDDVSGDVDVAVVVATPRAGGEAPSAVTLQLEADDAGGLSARVDNPDTGELVLDVDVDGLKVRRTALVLEEVNERWGQPYLVEGLVNTCGWEDGAGLSPDGEWLFTQALPVAINCFLGGGVEPCAIRGEIDAPFRPGLPGRNRISDDERSYDNGCPTMGVPWLPFPLPPNSVYGFRRQADGSYGEPFALEIADSDGCLSAVGFTAYALRADDDGVVTASAVWSYNDSTDGDDQDTQADLFFGDVVMGEKTDLGRVARDGDDQLFFDPLGARVETGAKQEESNPAPIFDGDTMVAVAYDKDAAGLSELDIYARVLDDGIDSVGDPGREEILPFCTDGVEEKQPFFTTDRVWFSRGSDVASVERLGTDLRASSSFGDVITELKGGGNDVPVGAVMALAESNVVDVIDDGGARHLQFVYVVRRPDGSLDLNIGAVRAR